VTTGAAGAGEVPATDAARRGAIECPASCEIRTGASSVRLLSSPLPQDKNECFPALAETAQLRLLRIQQREAFHFVLRMARQQSDPRRHRSRSRNSPAFDRSATRGVRGRNLARSGKRPCVTRLKQFWWLGESQSTGAQSEAPHNDHADEARGQPDANAIRAIELALRALAACLLLACFCGVQSIAAQAGNPSASPRPLAGAAAVPLALQSATAGDVLHLVVGHSILLVSAAPLRRVYVGNPACCRRTSGVAEIVLTAKTPG